MFDYSRQIEAYRKKRVAPSECIKELLLEHRKANRDRLISRLPSLLTKTRIGESNFNPQGSFAIDTGVQIEFDNEEYDIDDGLVIPRSQLTDDGGRYLTHSEVREKLREALRDDRFERQPRYCDNCIRVFYAETGDDRHHVDIPVYRSYQDELGRPHQELAGKDAWVESDPTQVNAWFKDMVESRNKGRDGYGTQFRRLVQLTKRFCRSRAPWVDSLPNGMKITMLVAECHRRFDPRIDIAVRELHEQMAARLSGSMVVNNLAHPNRPPITKSLRDQNIVALLGCLQWSIGEMRKLDYPSAQNLESARVVWDSVYNCGGFFEAYDQETAAPNKSFLSVIRSSLGVPWRERPRWRMEQKCSVSIQGFWSETGTGSLWHQFPSDSAPLRKHLHLRFTAKPSMSIAGSYKVYWQVVNTGEEAHAAGGLRGALIPSKTDGAGGLHSTTAPSTQREEETLYSGRHWVECYIVLGNVCLGKSDPFFVNIQ